VVQASSKPDAANVPPIARRTMTGGEALVASLITEGVDQIFGLPGVQLDGAFDALHARQQEIPVLHPRHEQGAAYMADGYARVTGRVGTCMVVPGPGLLNATAALSTAYSCNSPVLCVTGQIQSDMIEFGRGLLHEIPNQLGMIRSVTKWAGRAMTPMEIPGLVREAFTQMNSGRPRPVEIEIPPDVLFAVGEVDLLPASDPEPQMAGDPLMIEEAAALLANAKRPLIWAGGGITRGNAGPELLKVAEQLQAPIVLTSNGKGAVSDRHYLVQNLLGGIELIRDADVILAVGTRFVDPVISKWGLKPEHVVIQMDIDPEELSRNTKAAVNVRAHAKAGLTALHHVLSTAKLNPVHRKDELEAMKARLAEKALAVGLQGQMAMAIRRALPDNGIFVSEMTQVGYWSNFALPMYEPRTYVTAGYQGTLGYGFPTALGAKVGAPDQVVVSVNGDGGFGFCLNELSTMARHNIKAIAVVFSDDAYGNVRRIQTEQFGGRTIASDLLNPDFAKLAEVFGVAGRRAETPQALEQQLTEAIKADEPTVIEVPMPPVPNPWTALGIR